MNIGKKKTLIALVFLLIIACAIIFSISSKDSKKLKDIDLYFFNKDCSTITAETHSLDAENDDEMSRVILDNLIKGPSDKQFNAIMPKSVKVNSITNENGNVTVDFSDEYKKADLLATYAVVKSLCQLPDISRVMITVNGKVTSTPDGRKIGFITDEEINLESDDDCATGVSLYFADENTKKLVREYRKINITDTKPVEQYIVNELIKGTKKEKHTSLLATDTGIISVETTDGTCYVNFKRDFIDKNASTGEKKTLIIYSIVNSLTERSEVQNVQFLIEGKKTEKFGDMMIDELFIRNEALIAKSDK